MTECVDTHSRIRTVRGPFSLHLHTNVTLKCEKDDPCHEYIDTVVCPRGDGHEGRKDGVHGEHTIFEEIRGDDVERRVTREHVVVTVGQWVRFTARRRFRARELGDHVRDGTHEVHHRQEGNVRLLINGFPVHDEEHEWNDQCDVMKHFILGQVR